MLLYLSKIVSAKGLKNLFKFFLLMVIMDMENGNQVSKWDIIVPKILGGRGGG